MNKLIIVAHPNPKGFAHRIAQTYQQTSIEAGHDVKLINLYDPEWKQDYLMLDESNKPILDPKQEQIQSLITRANELVFCFPLRRFDSPAIMKNFLDVNFSSGFAFRYKK
jgi:NAD(P)H dehydrogenase (quinone)